MGTGHVTEYQTKVLDNNLFSYEIGDKIANSGIDIHSGKIEVYSFCSKCRESIVRWAIIINNRYVGVSNEYWTEKFDQNIKEIVREGPFR